MTFTDLDPKTALLVIDLQGGIVGLPPAHPADDVVSKSSALVKAFRRHSLPVVLVNVAGSPPGRTDSGSGSGQAFPDGWADLIHELDRQPEDIIVTKYAQVVIVGIATSSGVESTARHAHEHGFHVTLPVDAMTDPALASHEHSVGHVFPRIAETGTTQELLRLLEATR